MLTKLPGFYFTGYKNPLITPTSLTSSAQVVQIMQYYWDTHPGSKDSFDYRAGAFNSTDGIPKQMLYVKLTKNCTTEQREFLANGIRGMFTDQKTVFTDTVQLINNLNSSMEVFNLFMALIALISLTLVFFLLLVSTRQNVRENIWEYGVLRSMGFTKA